MRRAEGSLGPGEAGGMGWGAARLGRPGVSNPAGCGQAPSPLSGIVSTENLLPRKGPSPPSPE